MRSDAHDAPKFPNTRGHYYLLMSNGNKYSDLITHHELCLKDYTMSNKRPKLIFFHITES